MNKVNQQDNPTASLLSGVLLGVSVILLCLVTGELVLRHWFPQGGVVIQRDPRYLFKYVPNSRKQSPAHPEIGLERVLMTINREGRRGELAAAGRRPRVIVYGDSFIAAERSPLRETFVYQLQGMLGAKLSEPVQVLNAGVVGYGPDQESLMMEDQIGALKPDLVIAAIYTGNDFGDLIRNKLYTLDDHQQLVAGRPVLDPSVTKDFAEAEGQSRFQTVRHLKSAWKVVQSSAAVRKVRAILHRPVGKGGAASPPELWGAPLIQDFLQTRAKEYRSAVVDHDNRVTNLFFDSYDADVSLEPDSPAAQYKRLFMERIMERMQAIASRRSVPLVFLIIPAAIDAADWDLSIDAAIFKQYRRSALTDAIEGIAARHSMASLNLFGPFYARRAEGLYYRRPEDHWNGKGQQLAARLVTDYLVQNHVLR